MLQYKTWRVAGSLVLAALVLALSGRKYLRAAATQGATPLLAVVLGVALFPQISLVGPLYNLWRQIGLYNTWPGLIIPYMTFALPLSIYILSAFFREIPWELEKAAKVDGATPFQAFIRVIAPLAAPGMVTTAILVFLFCWNEFLLAITLTSTTRARTAPAAMASSINTTVSAAENGAVTAWITSVHGNAER